VDKIRYLNEYLR